MNSVTARPVWRRLVLLAFLAGVVGCGGNRVGEGEAIVAVGPSATTPARTAANSPGPAGPPQVENDAPAGICEDTANILSRVERVSGGLFRAFALDNRVGANDGDGIRGVRFTVSGEDITYTKDETTAPYCIFGGNEPDCGAWPQDVGGRYLWGAGGSVVSPGRYDVVVEVFGEAPDSLSGNDWCSWSFAMKVTQR